jgi:hypothetical protein
LRLEKNYTNTESIKDSLATKTKIDRRTIEACSNDSKIINTGNENGFISAVRIAHSHHVPLCLSPDHIWAMIIAGFCQHMEINHEQLRSHFVDFDGKKTLIVYNDFEMGNKNNNWALSFKEFST